MGGKHDNKNFKLRVSGYKRRSDIHEVEITECIVYLKTK